MSRGSGFQAAGWAVAGLLGGYVLFERLHKRESVAPTPTPIVSDAGSDVDRAIADVKAEIIEGAWEEWEEVPWEEVQRLQAEPRAPEPPALDQPPSIPSHTPAVPPATFPTPDPQAELERQYRMQLSLAKSKAASLDAAAKQECPDLKPGELRLPEAVDQCTRLRAEAAQAAMTYENLKREALRAGIWVQ